MQPYLSRTESENTARGLMNGLLFATVLWLSGLNALLFIS